MTQVGKLSAGRLLEFWDASWFCAPVQTSCPWPLFWIVMLQFCIGSRHLSSPIWVESLSKGQTRIKTSRPSALPFCPAYLLHSCFSIWQLAARCLFLCKPSPFSSLWCRLWVTSCQELHNLFLNHNIVLKNIVFGETQGQMKQK